MGVSSPRPDQDPAHPAPTAPAPALPAKASAPAGAMSGNPPALVPRASATTPTGPKTVPTPTAHTPTGLATAVKTKQMPWFHGNISRETAESLLNPKESEDGVYLVRESTNFPGDFTLCVVFQHKVEHYRVIMEKNKLTIDEDEYFENLTKLIEVRTVQMMHQ